MMRAKMYVTNVHKYSETSERIDFSCVSGKAPYGPEGESEDNTFARYTPTGGASLTVDNPALIGKLHQGDTFYVDFSKTQE